MRPLVLGLDIIQIREDGRRPAFKVEVYDIRTSGDTMGDIVRGLTLDADTGPRDFTADVVSVTVEETAGDFVETGITGNKIGLVIADPNDQFDPFNAIADPTGLGRWLRRGNVVRLYEGDSRIDSDDWPITFTGVLQGQAGAVTSRDPSANPNQLQTFAVDRSVGFLRYLNTSDKYEIGVSYLSMATSLATDDMGLDADEIEFAGFGSEVTLQPVQFIDEEPLVSIARLMMPSGFLPKFTGEGKLSQTQPLLVASPARTYFDNGLISTITRPFNETSPTNRVTVIGLDGVLSKAEQPRGPLGTSELTTGFFTQAEDVETFWSEDRTILAENIEPSIIKSVNGGLSFLGGAEVFTEIPAPNGQPGAIGMTLTVESGFAPWLVVFLLATYVTLSWIPDEVVTVGTPFTQAGYTINTGSAAAAIALGAALFTMTKIGRGVYSFEGDPFEMILAEIREIAEIDGILAADRIEVEVENHLIQWASVAATLARDILFEQQARGNLRGFRMLHDLRLEPHDTFETPDARTFLISQITRTLQRGSPVIATLDTFETTPGLEP